MKHLEITLDTSSSLETHSIVIDNDTMCFKRSYDDGKYDPIVQNLQIKIVDFVNILSLALLAPERSKTAGNIAGFSIKFSMLDTKSIAITESSSNKIELNFGHMSKIQSLVTYLERIQNM